MEESVVGKEVRKIDMKRGEKWSPERQTYSERENFEKEQLKLGRTKLREFVMVKEP